MKKIIVVLAISILLVSCNTDEIEKLEKQVTVLESELIEKVNTIDDQESNMNNIIESSKGEKLEYQKMLSEKDGLISEYMKQVDNLESVIIEYENSKEETDIAKSLEYNVDHERYLDYFFYDEDLGGYSRETLDGMLLKFRTGGINKIKYTEFDYFEVDYNGEDSIHEEQIFSNELKYYRLVTQFEKTEEMKDYFNQWFSNSYSEEIVNELVGTIEDEKKYVIYKDKLFTIPGDMGYSIPYFRVSNCKYKVVDINDTTIILNVIIPIIEDDYLHTNIRITEYELIYVNESDEWKLNKDTVLLD